MLLDELARIDPAARIFAVTKANEGCGEFSHLEMQVSEVTAASVSDGRDLLPAPNIMLRCHEDGLEVRVVRLHIFARAVLFDHVQDDNDVAPSRAAFLRKDHSAVGDRENGIAQVTIFAADPVEIVTEMPILREGLRVVSERAVLAADGEIKAPGGR